MSKQVLVLYPDMVTTVQYDKYQQVEGADFMGIVRYESRSFLGLRRSRGPMRALWRMHDTGPSREEDPLGWLKNRWRYMESNLEVQDLREVPPSRKFEVSIKK